MKLYRVQFDISRCMRSLEQKWFASLPEAERWCDLMKRTHGNSVIWSEPKEFNLPAGKFSVVDWLNENAR